MLLSTCWPGFFDAAQNTAGFLGCDCELLGHVDFLVNQQPPTSSSQGCSQFILHTGSICSWDFPNPSAGPLLTWGLHRPTSQACPGSSGWHCFTPACQLHHTAWCHWQTCWGCTQSHCPCHRQMLTNAGFNTNPWGTPFVTGIHLDIMPFTAVLRVQPSSQFLVCWAVHLSNPCLSSLDNDTMWDNVKPFAQVQADDIGCSSFIHQHCNLSHRRPSNLSDTVCPCWSHFACHKLPPSFPYAFTQLPGGSVPWPSWTQR